MLINIKLSPYTTALPEPIAPMEPTTDMVIYVDGSCQPNPGNMFVGVAIYYKEKLLWHDTSFVGSGTNNLAEYHAFVHAARALLALQKQHAQYQVPSTIVSDSRLAVDAYTQLQTPRSPSFGVLFDRFMQNYGRLTPQPSIIWVPRAKNKFADQLSKLLQPSTTATASPVAQVSLISLDTKAVEGKAGS